jgi:hypothetical protein
VVVDSVGAHVALEPLRVTASPKPATSETSATARKTSGDVGVEAKPLGRLIFATGRVPGQPADWSTPLPVPALEPSTPPEFPAPAGLAEPSFEDVDPGLFIPSLAGEATPHENPAPERFGTGISLSIDRQRPPVAEPPLGLSAPEDPLPSSPVPDACGVPDGAVGEESALPRVEWPVS